MLTGTAPGVRDEGITEEYYGQFLRSIQTNYNLYQDAVLFSTDVTNLWVLFLENIPMQYRQFYNCHCCRRFIQRYGGLCIVTGYGELQPVMWDLLTTPPLFKVAVSAMIAAIKDSRIVAPFVDSAATWGEPVTGKWKHFSVRGTQVHKDRHTSVHQWTMNKIHNYENMTNTLEKFKPETIHTASSLALSGQLQRSEKIKGQLAFLTKLKGIRTRYGTDSRKTENLIWKDIAGAPDGLCHINGSVLGTLMENIEAGDTEKAVKAFNDQMSPDQYQRPTAVPKAGNIAAAEKLFSDRGYELSLYRRYCAFHEISNHLMWQPDADEYTRGKTGIFAHLYQKPEPQHQLGKQVSITWAKFQRDVLPQAIEILFNASLDMTRLPMASLLTAAYHDAPPILQWDFEDARNPVSWYTYLNGSRPGDFNLYIGPNKVIGITKLPCMWGKPMPHQGDGVLLIVKDAYDTRYGCSSIGLFPEILRSELREVRSTIEAYSKTKTLEKTTHQTAGIMLQAGFNGKYPVTVISRGSLVTNYVIDRWE